MEVVKQDGTAATQALTAGTGLAKKLAANLTDCTGLKITCEATYTDPVSRAAAQVVASVEITKMEMPAQISLQVFICLTATPSTMPVRL